MSARATRLVRVTSVSAASRGAFAVLVAALALLATTLSSGAHAEVTATHTTAGHGTVERPVAGSAFAGPDLAGFAAQGETQEPTADSTAERGPRIEPEDSEQATEKKARTKAIIAAVVVALLVILYFGRKARKKAQPDSG